MLSLKMVSFQYRNKVNRSCVHVLENVSGQFDAGRVYSVLGPSGSGKTTLLSLMGGLEEPDTGSIYLNHTDIKDLGYVNLRRNHVAFVFQNYLLFPYLSALDNVILVMNQNRKSEMLKKQEAVTILKSLGLETDEITRKIKFLSGGQQQRVAIARCLATGADYILADEPTGNLDSENAEMIMNILVTLAREQHKCIVIATHSEMVKKYSDICYCLQDKKLKLMEEG